MNIESMNAAYGTSLWDVLYGNENKNNTSIVMNLGSRGGDTAIFSAAAVAKLEESQQQAQDSGGNEQQNGQVGAQGQAGGISETSNSEGELEQKIKALQKKLMQIQNSPLPEDTKVAQTSAILSQISVLQQELAQIKAAG